jgi:hypothetical protein
MKPYSAIGGNLLPPTVERDPRDIPNGSTTGER